MNLKMKNLIVVALMLSLSQSVHAAKVDYDKANPILKSLADEVALKDDLLESATPSFDKKTSDLNAGRLKYDLDASLSNPPWLKDQTPIHTAKVSSSSLFELHEGSQTDVLKNTVHIKVETDVLAFFKHAAEVSLKNDAEKRVKKNWGEKYSKETVDILNKMIKAKSISELHKLILALQTQSVDATSERANKNYDTYMASNYSDGYSYSEYQRYRKASNGLGSIKVEKTSINSKDAVVLSSPVLVNILSPNGGGLSDLAQVDASISITADSINLATYILIDMEKSRSKSMKSDIKKALVGINKGDTASEDDVRDAYKSALKEFKKVIIEHKMFN